MSENVVDFPREEAPPLLVGPFTYNKVVVDGRAIPNLTGFQEGEDRTTLIVDGRFMASFSNEDAYQVAWLIANAAAVALGYPSMSAATKDKPFAPQIGCIDLPT